MWADRIRIAESSEREIVQKFVVDEHLHITGYSDEAMAVQISELVTDYPDLYDDFVFDNSKCWVCFSIPQEDNIPFAPKLLGCIGIRHCSNDTAEIGYFFVDENVRGSGLGSALLLIAIEWVRNNRNYQLCNPLSKQIESPEYQYIRLITLSGLMEDAIRLYEKNNFVIYEDSQNPWFTLVYMRLALPF